MTATEKLSSTATPTAEIIDAFVKHLTERSWCLDVSGSRPCLLLAEGNRTACFETVQYLFGDWLSEQPSMVGKFDAESMANLSHKVAGKLPRVFGSSFRPTSDFTFRSRGVLMANTYRPFTPSGIVCAAGMALLDELAGRLLPDEAERKTFLQFFAHIVQHPEIRPQWGILFTGEGGTGKSIFVGLIEKALGGRDCWRENNYSLVFKNFSEVLPNNLLVVFDDAPVGGSTYEQLKHAMTSEFQEVEIKGQQRKVLREVYARIVALSNQRDLFDLTDDRRFFVPRYCTHPKSKAESDEFFRRLTEWARGPNCAATVRAWLLKVDLTDFDIVAPKITSAHQDMSRPAPSELAEMIAAYVADERIVHVEEVSHHLASRGHRKPSHHEIEKALTSAGYAGRRRPHPKPRRQIELWGPARRRRGRAVTPEEWQRMEAAGALH